MKQVISCALAIALVFLSLVPSLALTENRVYSAPASARAGETLAVPVLIQNNTGVMGFALEFTYDSALLTPVSAVRGAALVSGTLDDSIETSPAGYFKVVWSNTENLYGNGELFTLSFSVSDSAVGSHSVGVSFVQADTFNEAWGDVTLSCEDIELEITNPAFSGIPKFSAANASASAGANATVCVGVAEPSSLTAFSLTLSYDDDAFTYVSIGGAAVAPTADSSVPGRLTLIWSGAPISSDGKLFEAVFAVAEHISGEFSFALACDDSATVFAGSAENSALCVGATISVTNPQADEPTEIYCGTAAVHAGKTVDVPVCIRNNRGIMGFGITVTYDARFVTPTAVVKGGVTLNGSLDSTAFAAEPGSFKVMWNNTSDVSGDGTLFTVSFAAADFCPDAQTPVGLSYSAADTFNESWEPVELNPVSAALTTDAHSFGAWITDLEATKQNEGEAHRRCSECDRVERKTLDKLRSDPFAPLIEWADSQDFVVKVLLYLFLVFPALLCFPLWVWFAI